MDQCPICGIAAGVETTEGKTVYQCRNPQCVKYGRTIAETEGTLEYSQNSPIAGGKEE